MDRLDITVDRLLRSMPGQPMCDACLAFAHESSLREIQEITDALVKLNAAYRKAPLACASCGREVICAMFDAAAGRPMVKKSVRQSSF